MKLYSYFAISAAVGGVGLIGASVVIPMGSQTKNPTKAQGSPDDYTTRMKRVQTQMSDELAKGDFASAERDAKSYLVLVRNNPFGYLSLGDVYSAEHKYTEAWQAYRSAIMPSLSSFRDADRLLAFGAAAEATNHPDDARAAYRQIVDLAKALVGAEVLVRVDSGEDTVLEARNAALAVYAGTTHRPGYVKVIQDAAKNAPGEPACRYMNAWLLVPYGHIKDAKAEVDAAAALLPKDAAKTLIARTDEQFGFKAWGHGSKGVIGKGGNVTFTYFPTPLRNSNVLVVESVSPTRSTSPQKP